MMMKFSKICLLLLTGFALLGATACRETMSGAGQDIEKAGDNIQDAAN